MSADNEIHIPTATLTPIEGIDVEVEIEPTETEERIVVDDGIAQPAKSKKTNANEAGKKHGRGSKSFEDLLRRPMSKEYDDDDKDAALRSARGDDKLPVVGPTPSEKKVGSSSSSGGNSNDPEDPAAGYQITHEWIHVPGAASKGNDEKTLVERLYVRSPLSIRTNLLNTTTIYCSTGRIRFRR